MANWIRRQFIQSASIAAGGVASGAYAQDGWRHGNLAHLIPAANHERFAVKCSFKSSRESVRLKVDGRLVSGKQIDNDGKYFSFDVAGLEPDRQYKLQLLDSKDKAITDSWPLSTFPAPDASPSSVRLLTYTCAGGTQDIPNRKVQSFLTIAQRQRLLRRALSFKPHAMIAIGDHFYLDQRTQLESKHQVVRERAAEFYNGLGRLNLTEPAQAPHNELAIKSSCEPQIPRLYETMLRSTPSYFVNDDHDYFENDEAWDSLVTLPPHAYQLSFGRHVRNLFIPEFLPDVARPELMSGAGAGDREPGISESYGTFRYGNLAEALIYDCARFLSLKGDAAGLIAPEAEKWLVDRTKDQRVRNLLHVPSHPVGWTAGKWREWYADVADTGADGPAVAATQIRTGERFRLTTDREKFMWQTGWFGQHQRILSALAEQEKRSGIILSGDLHATGHGLIQESDSLNFSRNPVHAILTGPLGTGTGWPSGGRGTPPLIATALEMDNLAEVQEKNGFTIVDMTPDETVVRLFQWKRGEREEAIDNLEPYHTHTIKRRS